MTRSPLTVTSSVLLLLALWMPISATAFVPFEHDGSAAIPLDDEVVSTRALFSSAASQFQAGVLVRIELPLRGGAEGFLTIDMRLAGAGQSTEAHWTYYEKVSAQTISFEATDINGKVVVVDAFEKGAETSLHIEFSATMTDGFITRTIKTGYAITAPAPSILRTDGGLPPGIVVLDNGSGALAAGYSYERGRLDCYGDPDQVVVIDDYEYDDEIVEEVIIIEEEEIIVIDETDDYEASYDSDDSLDCGSDTTDYDDEYTTPTDDDSGSLDCSGDSSTTTDTSSDSDSGFDCEGDAEALVLRTRRFMPAPTDRALARRMGLSRRILQLSPMLLVMLCLLVMRERSEQIT